MPYDFIVVGAGSAGCVIASRLSQDPGTRVLLLEAGPAGWSKASTIPAAFSKLFKTSFDWAFHTEPEPQLARRRLYWPRGKGLGGSSAINAMVWTRGSREDFDQWAALGNRGWAYHDVRPYFERAERPEGAPGPGIPVSRPRDLNPLSPCFVEAGRSLGLAPNDGFLDGRLDGVGIFRVTQRRGARISAAGGYLNPARGRANLTVRAGCHVGRIRFSGRRAVGVSYQRAGRPEQADAGLAVILSAGTIGTPQLLLLSGVGPATTLGPLGISVVQDLPGVGENLQDHLTVPVMYASTRPITLAGAETPGNLLRYFVFRRGPLTSNVAEAAAFVRERDGAIAPDLELVFAPSYFVDHGFGNPSGHGYTIAAILMHPRSRGRVRVRSPDPLAPPVIEASYLSDPADLELLLSGIEWGRRLGRAAPLDPFRGTEFLPGASDQEAGPLVEHIRRRAETLYHPVGTCRMGPDSQAVVDPRLRVHGLEGLLVADASVMPAITTGHTRAPTVMIGERAAEWARAT